MNPRVGDGTRKSMRANRSTDTGPELAVRRALWKAGIRGYRVNFPGLPGKPDIAFTKHRLCVFINGCFWHGCPTCAGKRNLVPTQNAAYWAGKVKSNKERDDRTRLSLETAGWTVVVVWECEVRSDLAGVVNMIADGLGGADGRGRERASI